MRLQGEPGSFDAITDVGGLEVGLVTLVLDTSDPAVAARTGVTAILPLGRAGIGTSIPSGLYSPNGNGELTGSHWIRETGALSGPVMITNTHAVGTVHRGVIEGTARNRPGKAAE
jgi:L-aminopeptidase/D-esterase-like protein